MTAVMLVMMMKLGREGRQVSGGNHHVHPRNRRNICRLKASIEVAGRGRYAVRQSVSMMMTHGVGSIETLGTLSL